MFGETTIFYVMIWNHPIETTIRNWLFGVPGNYENTVMAGNKVISFVAWRNIMAQKILGGGFKPTWGDDPI